MLLQGEKIQLGFKVWFFDFLEGFSHVRHDTGQERDTKKGYKEISAKLANFLVLRGKFLGVKELRFSSLKALSAK
jgi:hypothetical protein